MFRQRKNYAINNALITFLVSMNKTFTEIIQIKYWGAGCWHSAQIMKAFILIRYFLIKRFTKLRKNDDQRNWKSLFSLPLALKEKENDKFRLCSTCLTSGHSKHSYGCMNFSIFLQISGSIWMQACVRSPRSVFIKINCVVAGYGIRPSAVNGTGQAMIWYKFLETEMRESCDVPNHSAHSGYCTLFNFQSQDLLYPFSHWYTLLRWELPSTHFLTNPWPPYVFAPILSSSLMIKWASLSPTANPPTTQLLVFPLSIPKGWSS